MDINYLSTIISTMQHLFAGVIIRSRDDRSIDEQLSEYEVWAKYDPGQTYNRTSTHRLKEYVNYLLILTSEESTELYVVSKEDPEIKALENYCPCAKCRASYLNPLRYIWCDHCTRCLRTGKNCTNPEFITQAKINREQAKKSISTWELKNFTKYIELIVGVIFVGLSTLLQWYNVSK